MKVLLWTRPNDHIAGGDLRQAEKTKEYLEKLGVEVYIKDNYNLEAGIISEYDIVHLFVLNLSNNQDKIKNICSKLVISPIYRDQNYGE